MQAFSPDSVAFVTGAASGIGQAVAIQLLRDGITNLAVLDLPSSPLATSYSSLPNPAAKVLHLHADVSQESEVDEAIRLTIEKFGRIDICFNAAGITGQTLKMEEQSLKNMERVLGVNLRGVWLCERAQIRQMMRQDMRDVNTGLPVQTRGSIVNVGSLASSLAISTANPYVMAKHGVLGLTKTDALDYGKEGIRVNCICPGWIKTSMTKSLWETETEHIRVMVEKAPMARWGFPEEVAFTVSFLLSDRASFMTGAEICVDGGYTIC